MSNKGVPSGTVSFDRPYALFTHPVNKIQKSGGSGEYLPWEFPLAFWLEQHGYDVSYISNIDTHADSAGLLRTKGFISVGHDEYWTLDMYDNVLKARDEGVNLAFLSANSVVCVVPLLPSGNGKFNRATRREGWFLPYEEGRKPPKAVCAVAGAWNSLLFPGLPARDRPFGGTRQHLDEGVGRRNVASRSRKRASGRPAAILARDN